jgi:NADPH2:quinone reductase
MRAIVRKQYGGPEVLALEERPDPRPAPGHVTIKVEAFGLNHAEIYFRKGLWGEVAEISGIECVGTVTADPEQRLAAGQTVLALVGGMGRSIAGSYAEFVNVPSSNVVAVASDLAWEELAAIPESYATAWTALYGNLAVTRGQTIAVRGATSALGQAAVNLAAAAGLDVIATTRDPSRRAMLESLGASRVLPESVPLAGRYAIAIPRASTRSSTSSATRPSSIPWPCCRAADAPAWSGFSAAAVRWRSNRCSRCRAARISASLPVRW